MHLKQHRLYRTSSSINGLIINVKAKESLTTTLIIHDYPPYPVNQYLNYADHTHCDLTVHKDFTFFSFNLA